LTLLTRLGRFNYGVTTETVDFEEPQATTGIDLHEYQISRQFVYFTRMISNVHRTIIAFKGLSKRQGEEYCLDPQYVELDSMFPKWFQELPADLQIKIPEGEHEPWKSSAFIGNLHCYYYLSIIMHHRPQIHHIMNNLGTDEWKPYMIKCLDAAKKMTRIKESMLETLGINCFRSMLRGMSFPIYCLLTCAMIHLVSRFKLYSNSNRSGCRHSTRLGH
jgi:hypothetical protein